MAHIIFYTKPGCLTSARQIELLRCSGHQVETRNLLTHPWQTDELLSYFGELPVARWFNPNSPRVKSGEIDPAAHDGDAALELLQADHLLIRRPLMESGEVRVCGFDPGFVHGWVGLDSPEEAIARKAELQSCSHPTAPDTAPACP